MSTAVVPLGMRTMPASGYNHHSSLQNCKYESWKGSGVNSYPVGMAAGHIRPLTNNDPGNLFPTGFGLARPLKHYRKGRVIPVPPLVPSSPSDAVQTERINQNLNRYVSSSKGTSLGGGFGGAGLVTDLLDKPGAYLVKENPANEVDETTQADADCATCQSVAIVTNYAPNLTYLTNNPTPATENPVWCCNEQRKARRRAMYASTNLKKNYYTTHFQYLQNRCQTYDQKDFNFLPVGAPAGAADVKPGSPQALALMNEYVANCFPNGEIQLTTEVAITSEAIILMCDRQLLTPSQCTFVQTSQPYWTILGLQAYLQSLPNNAEVLAFWGAYLEAVDPPEGPSNPSGCKLTVYKPSNYQFAQQGAVSSSTLMLKRNVNTISTNAASINGGLNTGQQLVSAEELYEGIDPAAAMNMLKNKHSSCEVFPPQPFQNKKRCSFKDMPLYQQPLSQPSPYRYYIGTVFSSNHFTQSPRRYLTPAN